MTTTQDHSAAYDTAPSLDGLLAAATPVEAEPFDLGVSLRKLRWRAIGEAIDIHLEIADYVRELRCTIDDRERVAINLEADAARTDARIAEALRWLDMAATYATSENVAAAIDDAAAALRGGA